MFQVITKGTYIDASSPAFVRDPHAVYRELRAKGPVHRDEELGAWVITTYQECSDVLMDDDHFSHSMVHWEHYHREYDTLPLAVRDRLMILTDDGEAHMRERRLLAKTLTQRSVERLRDNIRNGVQEDMAGVRGGVADLEKDVIAKMRLRWTSLVFGLQPAEQRRLDAHSEDVIHAMLSPFHHKPEMLQTMGPSVRAGVEYVRAFIMEQQAEVKDDLLGDLIRAEENGHRLSPDDLFGTVVTLAVAGATAATRMVGHGARRLLENPSSLRLLRENPELWPSAINEIMRYDTTAYYNARYAKVDCNVAGQAIRRGELVLVLIASANRDPRLWDDPDRFDITRPVRKMLSFGVGSHQCLGERLARMQIEEALRGIVNLPGLRINGPCEFQLNMLPVYKLSSLPIAWDA